MPLRIDRMKQRRLTLGLTQEQLALLVGVTQKAIAKWESGRTGRPNKLKELAAGLQCSDDWLLGGADKPETPKGVGLIGWVKAGALAESPDNYVPGDANAYYPYEKPNHSKLIALQVMGTSMNRISPDRSIVIVDLLDREMSGNRLYVVRVGNETTYKRFKDNPRRLEPDSTDSQHQTIFLDGLKAYPIGRVLRTMLDFD